MSPVFATLCLEKHQNPDCRHLSLMTNRVCVHAKSHQSCPTLCDPVDCSPLDSFVRSISQARILEWIAMPLPFRGSSNPGIEPSVLASFLHALAGRFFTTSATWEAP